MDGDSRQYRHHDHPQFPSTLGMGRRAAPTLSAGTTDRFRQAGSLPSARGEATVLSQAPGRAPIPSYVDYGYTDTSFQGASLRQGATQLQPYPPPHFQSPLPAAAQPAHPSPQRPQQQEQQQQQQQPPLNPYEQEVVYNFQQQQGPAHGPYGAVSPYPPRQSAAAIDALSGQFAVPQYFPASEPTGAAVAGMVPPYMNSHLPPSAAYNHPGLMGRSSATAPPFPANMADLTTPLGTAQQQQSPQQPQQPLQHQQPQLVAAEPASTTASNLSEAYGHFQRALRGTLVHSHAGRLVQASRSLLETSEWLVTNARELGILRDDHSLYPDQLRLWNDFNICWLSVFQMQKDLTQSLLQTGHQPPHVSLLSAGSMEQIGKELIQLCDQLEQHGLVDYQMGFWEEEILSVLSQCLDMMESRQETLSVHPMTATVTNTSRS